MSTNNESKEDDLLATTKQSLKTLQVQRQALESEAAAITSELTAPLESGGPPMGIDTPLTDRDGYPRADIDVYRARTLRGRLATIRNDHRTLEAQLSRGLERVAALQNPQRVAVQQAELAARRQAKPKPKYDAATGKWVVKNWDGSIAGAAQGEARSFDTLQTTATPSTTTRQSTTPTQPLIPTPSRPFARVNAVAPHSPAQAAGLLEHDLILRFGNITLDSPNGFAELARAVPQAAGEGQAIDILVQRGHNTSVQTLQLVPRPWEGRGLIGCHIVPLQH